MLPTASRHFFPEFSLAALIELTRKSVACSVIPFLALAILSQTQSSVSIVARGITVASLLKQVTTQTGVPMEAMPQTKSEIVIVSVKNVKVADFQDNLARAIGGRWKKEGNVIRLGRSLDLERAQQLAERKLRIEEVKVGLANLRKKVAAQPPFDAKVAHSLASQVSALYAKYKGHLSDSPGLEASMALDSLSPGGRLAIAAISELTTDQIADVEPGGRIVYCSDPTSMQRKLPDKVMPLVERFVLEQRLYSEELKRLPIADQIKHTWTSLLNSDEAEMPATVLISTERSPYNPSLTVRCDLVNKDGSIAQQLQSLIDLPSAPMSVPDIAPGETSLSEPSNRLMINMKSLQSGKTFLDDKVTINELSNLESHDPLSYLVADGVFGLAPDKNIIACVSDDVFQSSLFEVETPKGNIDNQKFWKVLNRECMVDGSNGWLIASPRRMVTTRNQRMDRLLASQFLRNSRDNDGATLEEMAAFAIQMPKNYMETLVPFIAFFVYPELNSGINDRNVELLRVYGRLTPTQRIELSTHGSMSVGALTQASLDDLNYLVYRADAPIQVMISSSRNGAPAPDSLVRSINSEITVALPSGVPQKATLTMNSSNNEAVIVDGGDSTSAGYQPLNAFSLGYMLARAEVADPSDKRERVRIDKYRYGKTRQITLELRLSESVSVGETFHESKFSRKGQSVSYDQLPDSFKKQVDEAKIQARKSLAREGNKVKVPPPF